MEKCGGSNVSTRRDFEEIAVEAESDEVIIRIEQYYSNKRRGGSLNCCCQDLTTGTVLVPRRRFILTEEKNCCFDLLLSEPNYEDCPSLSRRFVLTRDVLRLLVFF